MEHCSWKVEEAVLGVAPELDKVEAERATAPSAALIPPSALPRQPTSETLTLWAAVGELPQAASGDGTAFKEVLGEPVLFVRLDGGLSAYRPACPGCGESLAQATLWMSALICAGCGRRYDICGQGECLDTPQLHLEPIPLLVDDTGLVKVAVGAGRAG